ncbi:efflux RND transporter periplasmic adaptor subunit [Thalassotalea aquiviva]|uniref:efflux RND transporter periplasmic adaptor subunit n=1 Tax=Thalassotalea aquiviva TaxID=3242415 RepID=UPI003529FA80
MRSKIILTLSVLSVTWLALTGCEKPTRPNIEPQVVVDIIKQHPFKESNSFVGRLTAGSDIQIPARITAEIAEIHFQEGKNIEQGAVLFTLDDDEVKAKLAQMQAELNKAKDALDIARKNLKRANELKANGYISSSQIDELVSNVNQQKSALESARAQLDTAKLNLSYTKILAPIGGRIGRSEYSVGDLVGPSSGALTTIVAVNTMEVPFQVSENLYWQMVRRNQIAKTQLGDSKPVVKLMLNNELYPEQGIISYVANRVDPETGTLEVAATIPNPLGVLKPGQYVKVIVESAQAVDTTMIPQSSVQSDQQGDFVMILDANNHVQRRNVVLGRRVDTKVIVNEGVEPGETIVTVGMQRVRDGQKVQVKSAEMAPKPLSEQTNQQSQG